MQPMLGYTYYSYGINNVEKSFVPFQAGHFPVVQPVRDAFHPHVHRVGEMDLVVFLLLVFLIF